MLKEVLLITCLLMAGALEQGTIHIQSNGGQIESQRINFHKPTQNIPQVAISLLSSNHEIFAEVHDINQEGFTMQMMATQQLEADFAYIAIDDDENYQIECFNFQTVSREIQFPLTISKPTYIGVLATNTHANNFNIDLLDGNLIVDNDGQLNMCIIITNEESPINLTGYSNYEAKEVAQFHAFKKQNAMSLVQAQQSLEINHLDEHKSIEIWHHHSVEIIKDSSLEVYPTHMSLEVVDESQHQSIEILPEEYQQKESLEIFKVQDESPKQLIAEDVNLDIIPEVTQEDVKLDTVQLDDLAEDVQQVTEDVKLIDQPISEDIKLDNIAEDVKLDNPTEDVKLINDPEDIKLENVEDVKLDTEDIKLDTEDIKQENVEEIKLDDVKLDNVAEEVTSVSEDVKLENVPEDVQLENVAEDVKLDNVSEDVKLDNIGEDVKLDNGSEDVSLNTEEVKLDSGEDIKLDDVQNVDTEDIKLDIVIQDDKLVDETQENQQIVQIEPENVVQNTEATDQVEDSQIEDIKLDDTQQQVVTESDNQQLENIKFDDTKVETIKLEDIPVDQDAQVIGESTVEKEQPAVNQEEEVEVHADEVKIENVRVSEINPEEVKVEDISQQPADFSEPQQIVTAIPDEKEQEIEDMLRAAQELKEEVKELKKKSKFEQFDEKRLLKEKAQQLEEQVQEIEQTDQPQIIEDDISLDVNSGDEPETTVVETVEQPPIIYLNDDGVNPEQQLISEDVQSDQLQSEIDNELQTQEQQELTQQELQQQELQQQENVEILIVDDSIKLDEDHQELEPYSQVDESVKIEEEVVNLDNSQDTVQDTQQVDNQEEFEIDLTTDEAEPFIKKPKKSDFLREKQRLKDKLTNVIKDLRLDSVDTTSLDGVEEDQKKYSLIVDRLDVPENNENVIVLKDEDYQQEEVQQTQESNIVNLGDYVSDIEPSVENVNFAYDDEVQEQIPIQVEDIKLDDEDNYDDAETNYTVVEAKEDDTEILQSIDEPEQELISSEVVAQEPEQEQEITLDEFQKELDELANTIGAIKQESSPSARQSDYIVVNDNSQIYEASYDVQSYDSLQQDNDIKEELEDQTQYYQQEEQNVQQQQQDQYKQEVQQEQEIKVEQESTQQDVQEQPEQPDVQQYDQQQEIEQEDQQQEIEQQQQQVNIEEQQQTIPDDEVMQQQRYDDSEPQDQYLTIDNLIADNSSQESDDAYDQPPQYYDEQEQEQEQVQETQQEDNNEDNSQDFVVMKAEDFKQEKSIEPAQEQQNDESIEEATQVVEQSSDKQVDENEIDIIVDVASDDSTSQENIDQDYDYDFDEVKQQPKQEVKQQEIKQQVVKQQVIEPVQPAKQNKKNKNKLQHSITISHNQNNSDRSVHVQHSDMDETQEEMKQDLKQQLKQELKEELKQELQKEMQQEKMTKSQHSLVVEEKVEKNPERPAQKAINQFNDLLHDMVDNTLKESDNDKHHKLPIVDVNKESFKNVEPQIEAGIEDLKKALGLKGGVQVVAPDGTKQVINVDDLKKESEKLLSQPKQRKDDDSKYEEYLKKVTVKSAPSAESYEEQHNIRKQEILENIKRELEIKKGRFTVPNDTPQELSPYEFERVYLDWEKNKQDIIPSMLQHSIDQPVAPEQIAEVQQQKSDRVSRKEEVEKEVQELLFGNQKNSNKKGKMKEFRVEDLKYVKDDPLLDSTYHGFVQVKANLRRRKD